MSGVVIVPAIWLIGQVRDIWQLTALTAIVMFFYGITLAVSGLLTGLFARDHERGRVFGAVGTAPALGSLIGGAVGGLIVDHGGFPAFFTVVALWSILQPLLALLLRDPLPVSIQPTKPVSTGYSPAFPFLLLILATVLAGIGFAITLLGQPVLMEQLGLDITAISGMLFVSGLVILPLPLLTGWLSDRVGRKPVMVTCFAGCATGLVVLSAASQLWQFWLASGFLGLLTGSRAVGSAMATDMVPRRFLGVGISMANAMPWVANVVGTAGAGPVIQRFGVQPTFAIGALLPLFGIVAIMMIRRSPIVSQTPSQLRRAL